MAPKVKGKSGFPACCACGCGLVFFVLVFAVCLGAMLIFGFPLLAALRSKPALPEKPKITNAEWKSLEEKLRVVEALGSQPVELELTTGEFNALLSRFKPDPCRGLALHNLWMVSAAGKGTFVAEGSGFWLSSLILTFEVPSGPSAADGFPVFQKPAANRLELDGPLLSWLFQRFTRSYLSRLTRRFFPHVPPLFDKMEFAPDKIVLYGALSHFFQEQRR